MPFTWPKRKRIHRVFCVYSIHRIRHSIPIESHVSWINVFEAICIVFKEIVWCIGVGFWLLLFIFIKKNGIKIQCGQCCVGDWMRIYYKMSPYQYNNNNFIFPLFAVLFSNENIRWIPSMYVISMKHYIRNKWTKNWRRRSKNNFKPKFCSPNDRSQHTSHNITYSNFILFVVSCWYMSFLLYYVATIACVNKSRAHTSFAPC